MLHVCAHILPYTCILVQYNYGLIIKTVCVLIFVDTTLELSPHQTGSQNKILPQQHFKDVRHIYNLTCPTIAPPEPSLVSAI